MRDWLVRMAPWGVTATAILGLFGGLGLTIYRSVTEQPTGYLPLLLIATGYAAMCYGLAMGFEDADSDN